MLVEVQSDADLKLGAMRLDGESLKAPWIEGFRAEQGVDFTSVRFAKWWKLEPVTGTSAVDPPVGNVTCPSSRTRQACDRRQSGAGPV